MNYFDYFRIVGCYKAYAMPEKDLLPFSDSRFEFKTVQHEFTKSCEIFDRQNQKVICEYSFEGDGEPNELFGNIATEYIPLFEELVTNQEQLYARRLQYPNDPNTGIITAYKQLLYASTGYDPTSSVSMPAEFAAFVSNYTPANLPFEWQYTGMIDTLDETIETCDSTTADKINQIKALLESLGYDKFTIVNVLNMLELLP